MESSAAALIGGLLLLLDEGKGNSPGLRARGGDRAGDRGVRRCCRTGRARCREEGRHIPAAAHRAAGGGGGGAPPGG